MTKFFSRTAAIALVGLLSVAAPGAALAVSSSGMQGTDGNSAGVNSGPDGGLQINSTTAGSPGAVHRNFHRSYFASNCGPLYRWSVERHMCVINNPAL